MRNVLALSVMSLLVSSCNWNYIDDLPDSTEDRPIGGEVPLDSILGGSSPKDSIAADTTASEPIVETPASGTDVNQTIDLTDSLCFQQTADDECQLQAMASYVAFEGEVVVPEQVCVDGKTLWVTSIADFAFHSCPKITSVSLPGTIRCIGESVFDGCKQLVAVNVAPDNSSYYSHEGVLYQAHSKTLVKYPAAKTGLYQIPEGTLRIRQGAFLGSSISAVIIPESVVAVGSSAFYFCPSLRRVEIGRGVTQLEAWTFSRCDHLQEVIVHSAQPPVCQSRTFDDLPSATLYVPQGAESAYQSAEGWRRFGDVEGRVLSACFD